MRCLHRSKNLHRKKPKKVVSRSRRLLLNLLFWFVKVSLIREAIVILLKKGWLTASEININNYSKPIKMNLSPTP